VHWLELCLSIAKYSSFVTVAEILLQSCPGWSGIRKWGKQILGDAQDFSVFAFCGGKKCPTVVRNSQVCWAE